MLTKKQIKQFTDWYKNLYSINCNTEVPQWLPCIFDTEEEAHIQMWKNKLSEIIWPRISKRPYIHKWWRKDTWLWKVFEELRLWYWPRVVKDSWRIITMEDGTIFKTKNHTETIEFLWEYHWPIKCMEKIDRE